MNSAEKISDEGMGFATDENRRVCQDLQFRSLAKVNIMSVQKKLAVRDETNATTRQQIRALHDEGSLVEEQASVELRRSPYPEVRKVKCTYREGVLTLTGRVPTYFHKQIAQCVVLQSLADRAVIDNQVHVSSSVLQPIARVDDPQRNVEAT